MDLECWLQCPKCKKQSRFLLKDILAKKPVVCRLCKTAMEINYPALEQTRHGLQALAKDKDKG
ncbi:MAG: hypothetical protein M0Z58_04810 [Nitrospiraceae bacterium]|nr:hypothetical protein [Nitrospiraceae bacterium]